jgi:hypothetical protein
MEGMLTYAVGRMNLRWGLARLNRIISLSQPAPVSPSPWMKITVPGSVEKSMQAPFDQSESEAQPYRCEWCVHPKQCLPSMAVRLAEWWLRRVAVYDFWLPWSAPVRRRRPAGSKWASPHKLRPCRARRPQEANPQANQKQHQHDQEPAA